MCTHVHVYISVYRWMSLHTRRSSDLSPYSPLTPQVCGSNRRGSQMHFTTSQLVILGYIQILLSPWLRFMARQLKNSFQLCLLPVYLSFFKSHLQKQECNAVSINVNPKGIPVPGDSRGSASCLKNMHWLVRQIACSAFPLNIPEHLFPALFSI